VSASASISPAFTPATPLHFGARRQRYAVIASVVHPDRYVIHDDITRRIVSGPDGLWRSFPDRIDALALADEMNAD
jgi:hypothetical protein